MDSYLYTTQLFMGLPINAEKAAVLEQLSPALRALLIKEDEACLTEVTFNECKFLGKFAGKFIDMQQLELLKCNVFSLLKSLLPSISISEEDIVLLAIPEHE